ncbi:MAG: hypothetical protein ACTSPI_14095 [Candidatus Heimdallarchaeaceae archaeon]
MNELKRKKKFDLPKKINSIENTSIKVGFPAVKKETHSEDKQGVSAVFKATVNNFGLGVPKRPFMDISFAKNKSTYKKLILKELGKIEKLDFTKFANKLGILGQGHVQKEITALRSPANNPMTISAKGSSNPLINTGHTLQSVTFAVGKL